MLKGLQTHFNARIEKDILTHLKSEGFETIRIDAMTCSQEVMLEMFQDALDANLIPFVIVESEDKLNLLPSGIDVEWTNEPDGDISPASYFPAFNSACSLAKSRGIRLWAPTISNLDEDSLRWLNDLRNVGGGWPEGLFGISAHRYGDGSFEDPHDGFTSRESEVKWLKAACAGKPFLISEVGYPTTGAITDGIQLQNLQKEVTFWEKEGAYSLFIYQLNDGEADNEKYGVRRVDGSWKPSASIFNQSEVPVPDVGEDMQATEGVGKEDLISVGDNKYVVRYPFNADTVLSIQPDGKWETRPAGTAGSWEVAELKGDALKYRIEGKTFFVVVK